MPGQEEKRVRNEGGQQGRRAAQKAETETRTKDERGLLGEGNAEFEEFAEGLGKGIKEEIFIAGKLSGPTLKDGILGKGQISGQHHQRLGLIFVLKRSIPLAGRPLALKQLHKVIV